MRSPSVSFCEALFANSPFFLQNDKAELLIWTNCFRPVSRQSHGQILGAGKNTSNLSPQFCIILLNLPSLKIMAFCFLRALVTISWFSKQNFFNRVVYPIPHGFLLPKAKVIEIVSHHEIFTHNPHGFEEPLPQTTFYCKNLHFIVNFQLQSNQGFLWIKSWIFQYKRLLFF